MKKWKRWNNIEGRITKGVGGFYYVNDGETIHECKACGRFRKEKIKPVAGDYVVFTQQRGQEYGFIEQILPRKNLLTRPAVANLDVLVIVVSAGKPHMDFVLSDKLLIQAQKEGIRPVLCINKTETDKREAKEIEEQYAAFDVLSVSAHSGEGIAALKELVRDNCVCFTGQSAVGKSSLINVIDEKGEQETGEMSKKTARGKHTTRITELLYIQKLNAYVFDTPGFSMFDVRDISRAELPLYYPDFAVYSEECRFTGCMHDKEPGCGVKKAVESGKVHAKRYERYLRLKEEIKDGQGE